MGHLAGAYQPDLVALSFLIALVASFVALNMAGRVATASGDARRVWLGGGAVMMGLGIWSMHFVGMLAFDMGMPVTYDPGLTALSLGLAVVGAWAALQVASRARVTRGRLAAAALFMGLAINAMHYMGMAGMRMQAQVRYRPGLFALSVVVAVAAALGALTLAFRLKAEPRTFSREKVLSALFMAVAIAGMHYVGMAAAVFEPTGAPASVLGEGVEVTHLGAAAVGGASLLALGLTFLTSVVDAERGRAQHTLELLAEASELVGRSLDTTTIAGALAGLVASRLAEGCAVDVQTDEAPVLRRLAVRRRGRPGDVPDAVGRTWALDPASSHPLQRVLRSGRAELLAAPTEAQLAQLAGGREGLWGVPRGQACAVAVVPLRVGERVRGVLAVWGCAEPLTAREVAVAEELGRRAGAAMENARLFHEAQEAIRIRDEFLSIASHELNTPLTPLQLHLQRLEAALASADGGAVPAPLVSSAVAVALRQTARMKRLVSELLDISRIRLGRLALERDGVDLEAVARRAVARLGFELEQSGSRCEVQARGALVGHWDGARLEQVVASLLANAVKYGQGRPIDVTLTGEGGVAQLAVRDRGMGIPPEDRQRIFERFERAASRNFGGLGLGLYIVRQIVEAHGGSIHVESALGEGSTFTVLLPLEAASVGHAAS
jgi:NO-binding membrane sensor protein with MHYT domain/anti-sigma regulatory factor (Ser/Thr protein kinase)